MSVPTSIERRFETLTRGIDSDLLEILAWMRSVGIPR